MMRGIYIVHFDMYPGIYKIGRSKNVEQRYKQFKNNTVVLGNVQLIYKQEFLNEIAAERNIHQILKQFRYKKNREFFQGDVEYFKKVIEYVYNQENIYNYDKFFYNFIVQNSPLLHLKSIVCNNIITWLCTHMETNTNKNYLTTVYRKQLQNDLLISNNQLTNNLKILKNLQIIKIKAKECTVNPRLFWKGDLKIRLKLLNSF